MAAHIPVGSGAQEQRLLSCLASFCSTLAFGKLPTELRDLFCAARLIALPKKPNGVRPIAVGETLRRLSAKLLVMKFQPEAAEALLPLQVGVGIPGATEAVIHKVREWMRSAPPDHALLQVDFANAFNTIDRSAMLSAIARRCPKFLPYATFCYGASTPLIGDTFSLESCTGTQQGDACGPLFFSVTAHDVALAANVAGTSWAHWYLDDGTQTGAMEVLAAAMEVLEPKAAAIGLHLNRAKCKLWGPGAELHADDSTLFPSLSGIPRVPWSSGLRVLGTPVGRAPYVRTQLAESADKLAAALEKLECLGCPQSSSLILRSCLGAAKIVHLLRTAFLHEAGLLASRVQPSLKAAWVTVVCVHFSETQWGLGCFPVRLGGCGIVDPVRVHPQAAVASFLASATGPTGIRLSRLPPDLLEALGSLRRCVPGVADSLIALWSVGSLEAILQDSQIETWSDQKAWTWAVDQAAVLAFDAEASTRIAQLRKLQTGAHSGWVTNLPLEHDRIPTFAPSEFQALLRFRCGIPFQQKIRCGGCSAPLDSFGDHALSCPSCGLYSRHNRLRDALAEEYIAAGYVIRIEAHLPGDRSRPADILVLNSSDPSPMAVDVSIVHPLHLSSASAEDTPGTAAAAREAGKLASSGQACAEQGWRFTPVCVETTGAWGPGGQKAVRALVRKLSMRTGEPVAASAGAVWRRLSTAAAKGAAQMLLRAFPETFIEPDKFRLAAVLGFKKAN